MYQRTAVHRNVGGSNVCGTETDGVQSHTKQTKNGDKNHYLLYFDYDVVVQLLIYIISNHVRLLWLLWHRFALYYSPFDLECHSPSYSVQHVLVSNSWLS